MDKNKFRDVTQFNNIKEIVYNSSKIYEKEIAFTTKIKKEKSAEYINYTFGDLLRDINYFGSALYKLGLKGKRVAIIGRNRYEWAVAHLSCMLGGIVSVPLDKGLQQGELEESLVRSKADAIIYDEKFEENIELLNNNNKTNIKKYISMGETKKYERFNNLLKKGEELVKKGYKEYQEYKVNPDEMSILLFTSGTTSKSKAVMLNQRGIAVNVSDMLMVEKFETKDTNIAFLPYHHIFGSTCMVVMIAAGVRTVFPDGLRYIKQNLKEYEVSVFVGVPILIDKIYSAIEKEIEKQGKTRLVSFATKLSNLLLKLHIDIRRKLFKSIIDNLGGKIRFIISGGAPLDKRVAIKFNEMGIHLVQGYGLTETSPVIAAENDYYVRAGSVGIPMKSMQVEIENKNGGSMGEIKVKGPNVMLGYYENEEETKKVLKNGWFYTGDLGYFDKDGFLFITGREKDVIVLKNGKKVFPEELEILINRIDEVAESFVYGGVIGEDKNDLKVSVKIVFDEAVVSEKYGDITQDELYHIIWNKIKEINKTLPQYKYIKSMRLTSKGLIKTTTNKIKRKEEMAMLGN